MRKIIYFLIVIVGVALLANPSPKDQTDKKVWLRIDSLENEGLYRTALQLTEQVYYQAKEDLDAATEIKALIYRLKYIQELEEDGQIAAINALRKELPDERLVQGSLKNSILAELYYRYFSANRWQISQNPIEDPAGNQNMKTWSPERFYRTILDLYEQSMVHGDRLFSVKVSSLPDLWSGNLADTLNKPALFDILVSRTLNFLQNAGEFSLPELKPEILCSPELFNEPNLLINNIPKTDSTVTNPYLQTLKWYHRWMGRNDGFSILPVDLQRLNYLHEHSCNSNRDSLYESALLRWTVKLGKDSSNATVFEALAQYHLNRSYMFRINDPGNLIYKEERKTAVTWLVKSREWATTQAAKRCSNLLTDVLKPELSIQAEACQLPATYFPVSLEYRNLPLVYYRVLRMNALTYYSEWSDLETEGKLNRIHGMEACQSGKIDLPDDGYMNPHRTRIIIDPLPSGFYLLVFSNMEQGIAGEELVVTAPVSVTGTTYVNRQSNGKGNDFYFRNRETGSPLSDLTVIPWYTLYDRDARRSIAEKGKARKSGQEGFLEIPEGGPGRDDPSPKAYRLEIINKKDTLVTGELFYPGSAQGKIFTRTSARLYTDRNLYKPGDEVFFRGVLIDYIGDSMAIHGLDTLVLALQDPRYQIVSQMILSVDSLGVFWGTLKLPYKGLTGSYLLSSKFGQASIRMEQYRRPAFSVKIIRGSEILQPGAQVEVSGVATALSGEPVSEADVFAEVDIQPVSGVRWGNPMMGQKIRVTTIHTKTDAAGKFTCSWTPVPEGSNPFQNSSMIRYRINIRVTDLNGESHQEETILDSGKGTISLLLSVPDKILITDSLSGSIGAFSSDGRTVKVPVRLIFSKIKDPVAGWIEPVLPEPDVFSVSLAEWRAKLPGQPYNIEHKPSSWGISGKPMITGYPNDSASRILINPVGKMEKGWYKVELNPVNSSICKGITRFVYVEDPQQAKVDEGMPLYAQINGSQLSPGQTLDLRFGSGNKGYVLLELREFGSGSKVIWVSSDKKIKTMSWDVTKAWQGGAMLRLIRISSNRVYEKQIPVMVPWDHSELNVSGLEDLKKVKPGDSVKLNIRITDEKGNPAKASLGITVYDASLDLISPHMWPPLAWPSFRGGPTYMAKNCGLSGSFILADPVYPMAEVGYTEPVELNWFGYGFYGFSRMGNPELKMAMAQPAIARGAREAVNAKDSGTDAEDKASDNILDEGVTGATDSENGAFVLRSDFKETAVFKGSLLTDINGIAKLNFKVPDVFTDWKVLVTCLDSHLAFGNFEHHFKSTKELMIKSNFPRFMRNGDTVELSARLGWYGTGPLMTATSLIISDASGQPVRKFPDVNSNLKQGGVAPFSWRFAASGSEPITYKIVSTSGGPNDGLEDTIRVYPDEVRLWMAQPFFFSRPGKKTLRIEGDPLEASFEVTTSPAWQVLQSLPVVNKEERDCSEYWFSRLYLACLTGSIADRYPEITAKFLSDSVPETQKDRIAQIREWMVGDTRGREQAYILEKLSNLQNPDGSWPWFKGSGTDLFMTQQIIAGFGEMKTWGIYDITNSQRGKYMITQAIESMDHWMYLQFRELLRVDSAGTRKIQLNPLLIHYLYARSFFSGLSLAPENEIAWIHFTGRLPLEWTQHEPGLQALMAIASIQMGRMRNAIPIYRSLRERAKEDDQWGMYWPRKGYASSWFEWDLWMQSRMIELFAAVEEGQKDLDKLKVYLIHQKRGRDWGNGMVAAWASKSLLLYGNKMTFPAASVSMTWGTEQYSSLRIKTGSQGVTGYYRYEWKNPDEMPKSKSVEVVQTDGGPSWGTLFTLNNYSLDKLSSTGGPLTVIREVMIAGDRGSWSQIRQGQNIKVGDKVRIRLSINSDRELSYIEIKDFLGTGFMPVQVLSGYQYQAGLSYYQSREPESVICYVPQLPKGVSVIEYQSVVEQAGNYFGGYTTATSLYAPEFRGWSNSIRIQAKR